MEPATIHEDRRAPVQEALDGTAPQRELGVAAERDPRREVEPPGEPRAHLVNVGALHVEPATRLDDPEMVVDGLEGDDGNPVPGGGLADADREHDEQRERRGETGDHHDRSKHARPGRAEPAATPPTAGTRRRLSPSGAGYCGRRRSSASLRPCSAASSRAQSAHPSRCARTASCSAAASRPRW